MDQSTHVALRKTSWNEGRLVGQKAPLKLKDIWAIRIRLQIARRTRELALFNLAIDSKLRSCDLVKLRMRDGMHSYRAQGVFTHPRPEPAAKTKRRFPGKRSFRAALKLDSVVYKCKHADRLWL